MYSVRENPLDLGLVGLAEFLPLLLLALPAGHLADRIPRRRIYALMVVTDIVFVLALLGVTLAGADHVWPFFVLAFLTGVSSAFGAPAGRALTPSLVPQEILVSALAQRSIAFQISHVAGPAIGGILFAIQPELVYAVSAALSLIALVACLHFAVAVSQPPRVQLEWTKFSQAFVSYDERRSCSERSPSISSLCSWAAPSRCSRSLRKTFLR